MRHRVIWTTLNSRRYRALAGAYVSEPGTKKRNFDAPFDLEGAPNQIVLQDGCALLSTQALRGQELASGRTRELQVGRKLGPRVGGRVPRP